MADIRINALATTAASTASDDYIAIDGSANGTRKLSAYSPTFGGNLTVSGTGTSSVAGTLVTGTTSSDGTTQAKVQITGGLVVYGGAISNVPTSASIVIDQQPGGVARIMASGASTWSVPLCLNPYGGNLLLGTTTDGGQKLQVEGNAKINSTGATTRALSVTNSLGNIDIGVFGASGIGYVGTTTATDLQVFAHNAFVLGFDSAKAATFTGKITAAGAIVTTGSVANMLEVTSSSTNATNFNLINSSTGAATWSIGSAGSACGTGDAAGALYFYQGSGTKFVLAKTTGNATFAGTITPQQAATASAPTYVKGAIYFDTTLNKLRVGGATGWETVTSV